MAGKFAGAWRKIALGWLAALALVVSAAAAEGFTVTTVPEGVKVDAGDFGAYTVTYPRLVSAKGEEKPHEVKAEGAKAELKYASGIELTVSVDKGVIRYVFAKFPEGVEKINTDFVINNRFAGTKWKIDGQEGVFPAEKPAKPHLYQGNAKQFTFGEKDGRQMTVTAPAYTFLQLQDNREWNWEVYQMCMFTPVTAATTEYSMTFEMQGADAPRKAQVDSLGQSIAKDFPGKMKDEAELVSDISDQERFFSSFTPQALDEFGGLPESGAKLGLKKTGFFHVERKNDRWILVDPAGNAFFQLGVCCVSPHNDATLVKGRQGIYSWLPEQEGKFAAAWHPEPFWKTSAVSFYTANLIRKYGDADPEKHLERMIGRLRSAGFNSHGAWSLASDTARRLHWPYTGFLPVEPWNLNQPLIPGVRGMFDPFAPAVRAAVDKKMSEVLPASASDPYLIGYFLENEQGLEDLPRAIPALNGEYACKQRLVKELEAKYKDIAAFNAAWGVELPSFAAVAAQAVPVKTKAAFADMQAFTGVFLDAYHGLLRETFDKYDRNHMLIGGRWQPGTANSEVLCRSAGKFMDIISVNYYAYGIDEEFIRQIYRWSGEKPMLWSEFHYGSGKDSGLPGRMDVGSQKARGAGYRNYVEGAAALGFVVGTQWFQCIDEPLTGRYFEQYTGENYNIGLFSVVDRPYRELLTAMAETHARVYKVWLEGEKPFVFDHPMFSRKARAAAMRRAIVRRVTAPLTIDGQMDGWPNMPPELIDSGRTVMGVPEENAGCSFKLAFDADNLYIIAQVRDATPLCNQAKEAMLWNGDGLELFIGAEELERGGPLLPGDRQVLLSAGCPGTAPSAWIVNVGAAPEIKVATAPAVDGKGYSLEAAIPWKTLGLAPKGGERIRFDLGLDNNPAPGENRATQMMWNGTEMNSGNRTGWGMMELDK